jgi:hypothetical protein
MDKQRAVSRGSTPGLPALIAGSVGILLVILATVTTLSAQELGTEQRVSSVDSAFSRFWQVLETRATDILANAQHPTQQALTSPVATAETRTFVLLAAKGDNRIKQTWALSRVRALQPVLDPILSEEGIPQELLAVVLIESGGQQTALSRKGALGLWQLMPETARRYGLIVTPQVDERLDVQKSTRAAARYLRDLYSEFGNWSLALAGYNAGADRVDATLTGTPRRDFGYSGASARLPIETQRYVPAVLNAIGLIKDRNQGRGQPNGAVTNVYASAAMEN